jgi:hypothetical protein
MRGRPHGLRASIAPASGSSSSAHSPVSASLLKPLVLREVQSGLPRTLSQIELVSDVTTMP